MAVIQLSVSAFPAQPNGLRRHVHPNQKHTKSFPWPPFHEQHRRTALNNSNAACAVVSICPYCVSGNFQAAGTLRPVTTILKSNIFDQPSRGKFRRFPIAQLVSRKTPRSSHKAGGRS